MIKKKLSKSAVIMMIAFLLFNLINAFLSTTDIFNTNLSPYRRTFPMVLDSIFGDIGFFLLFVALSFFLFKKEKNRSRFLMYSTLLLSFLLWGLSMYIDKYGMLFSFFNLRTFGMSTGGDSMAFVFDSLFLILKGGKIIFILPFFLVLLLFIILYHTRKQDKNVVPSRKIGYGMGTLFIALGCMMLSYGIDNAVHRGSWFEENKTPLYGTQSVGVFNYYISDAYRYFNLKNQVINEDKKNETIRLLEEYKNECRKNPMNGNDICNAMEYKGKFKGKNLLLIQAESLNNFVIGLKVKIGDEEYEITPNLNKMVKSESYNSIYFKNFQTTVGIGNTSDAEFSAMTGLYPTGPAYTIFEYNEVEYETLARLFQKEGYDAFSIHANTGMFYDRFNVHEKVYGFDKHYGREDLLERGALKNELILHSWLNDTDFLRETVSIMNESKKAGKQVFSFAISVSNHMPYRDVPELYYEHEALFPEDFHTFDETFLGYLKHVNYFDFAIGELITSLEEKNLLEDTIIAIYGDHGSSIPVTNEFLAYPEMFENEINGVYGKDYAKSDTAYRYFPRALNQNIPFIICDLSNTLEPSFITRVKGITDIKRTLSNLFDLDQEYYFGYDALVDQETFVYNPRNLDIFIDDYLIPSPSVDWHLLNEMKLGEEEDVITMEEIKRIISEFEKYKEFNDRVLKYKLFPEIKEKKKLLN